MWDIAPWDVMEPQYDALGKLIKYFKYDALLNDIETKMRWNI